MSEHLSYLLVTGAPRSGTTLLKDLINTHPGAYLFHERYFTQISEQMKLLHDLLRPQSDLLAPNSVLSAELMLERNYEETRRFYEDRDKIEIGETKAPDAAREFSYFNRAFWDWTSGKHDLQVIGNKLPVTQWTKQEIDLYISKHHPKIIYIIRNPLDVVNSSMRRRYSTDHGLDNWPILSVESACFEWHRALNLLRDILSSNAKDSVLIISYEDLCRETSNIMNAVFEFLELPSTIVEYQAKQLPQEMKLAFLGSAELAYAKLYFDKFTGADTRNLIEAALDPRVRLAPPLQIGAAVRFSDMESEAYCLDGFYEREAWGRWTGPKARLKFVIPPGLRDSVLELRIRPSLLNARGSATCYYKVNDARRVIIDVSEAKSIFVDLSIVYSSEDPVVVLELAAFEAKTPSQAAVSDPRVLGLALEWFAIIDYSDGHHV
ncbi:hypothetical protein IMSHALPRED_006489 [Imshaugia aleurites]|uniref:protein-tyrosine sulfotransferase n=1 Tax=Imshaugia aleurites TaxID=172621 RepID=A0A8H3J8Y6_9LECA|nr:hypothetical protein IMSHALPRED_006489 [Imshaugia aleurites]